MFTSNRCLTNTNDKTYTSHGMTITMPDGFYEKSLASVTVSILSSILLFDRLRIYDLFIDGLLYIIYL